MTRLPMVALFEWWLRNGQPKRKRIVLTSFGFSKERPQGRIVWTQTPLDIAFGKALQEQEHE